MDLDLIRRRHKWLTLSILFFISIAFIFGIGSFVTGDFGPSVGGPMGSAAEVNGEDISMREYALERANMRRQFGQDQDLSQEIVDIINIRALNQLIDYKLLAQKAEQMGFAVTNDEFNRAIHSDPSFQIDGQFVGVQRYTDFIENGLGQNLTEFEKNYKQRMVAQKLARFIGETVFVTDEKLMATYDLQNETVNLNYIEFSSSDFISEEGPSEEEIEKHYQSSKANFKTDELRKIRYIILEPENFENSVEISEEEITAYYNAYPEEFKSEDGNTLSLEEAKNDVASNLKSQRAEVIRQEFIESFEFSPDTVTSIDQMAKDHSIETINESAAFAASERTGDIPPQIINKAYSTEKGITSVVPVGTSLWVVEVSEISEPREKTLEEVKPEVIDSIKNQKSKTRARQKANQALSQLRSAKKQEIADKAQELGLSLKETGPFTRSERIPEINIEQVKSDAFAIDDNNTVLGKVYDNGNNFYVVIFKERLSADPAEFELKKAELQQQELQAERNALLLKWIQDLRREAKIEMNDDLFPSQG